MLIGTVGAKLVLPKHDRGTPRILAVVGNCILCRNRWQIILEVLSQPYSSATTMHQRLFPTGLCLEGTLDRAITNSVGGSGQG